MTQNSKAAERPMTDDEPRDLAARAKRAAGRLNTELAANADKLSAVLSAEPAYPHPVTQTTRLGTRGQTSIIVAPPAPCGLGDCVAELHVTIRHDTTRIHLDDTLRRALIVALGGTWSE